MNQTVKCHTLGFVISELSEESKIYLKNKTSEILKDEKKQVPHNNYLAGNIEKEFLITDIDNLFIEEVFKLSVVHSENFPYLKSLSYYRENLTFQIGTVWCNFQKKYEFNPMHDHDGVFSFVTWVNVPFIIEDEKNFSPGVRSNGNKAGIFDFFYTGFDGTIQTESLNVDRSWEGKLLLFPSKMKHCVYPFYSSDDYRISVSGNVFFKTAD